MTPVDLHASLRHSTAMLLMCMRKSGMLLSIIWMNVVYNSWILRDLVKPFLQGNFFISVCNSDWLAYTSWLAVHGKDQTNILKWLHIQYNDLMVSFWLYLSDCVLIVCFEGMALWCSWGQGASLPWFWKQLFWFGGAFISQSWPGERP